MNRSVARRGGRVELISSKVSENSSFLRITSIGTATLAAHAVCIWRATGFRGRTCFDDGLCSCVGVISWVAISVTSVLQEQVSRTEAPSAVTHVTGRCDSHHESSRGGGFDNGGQSKCGVIASLLAEEVEPIRRFQHYGTCRCTRNGGGGGSRTPVRKALRHEAYMLSSIPLFSPAALRMSKKRSRLVRWFSPEPYGPKGPGQLTV